MEVAFCYFIRDNERDKMDIVIVSSAIQQLTNIFTNQNLKYLLYLQSKFFAED